MNESRATKLHRLTHGRTSFLHRSTDSLRLRRECMYVSSRSNSGPFNDRLMNLSSSCHFPRIVTDEEREYDAGSYNDG